MDYSFNDVYPFMSKTATTTELTQEDETILETNTKVSKDAEGRKVYTDVKTIWYALLLFIIVTMLIHFIK